MQCPKCNRKNPMKNAFCVHCGEDLRDGEEESPGNPAVSAFGPPWSANPNASSRLSRLWSQCGVLGEER